jgi:hypothetical protein
VTRKSVMGRPFGGLAGDDAGVSGATPPGPGVSGPGVLGSGQAGPVRYCPSCFAENRRADRFCRSCGAPLDPGDDFAEKLVWALDHPVVETAILAASIIAQRRDPAAVPHLVRVALTSPEPYRARAAAAALRAFRGDPEADAALARLRRSPSALMRAAVAEPNERPRRAGRGR